MVRSTGMALEWAAMAKEEGLDKFDHRLDIAKWMKRLGECFGERFANTEITLDHLEERPEAFRDLDCLGCPGQIGTECIGIERWVG